MRNLLIILLLSLTTLYANINVVVTIVTMEGLVKEIGGDKVNVQSLIPKGANSHTYEPTMQTMKAITHANAYFTIGLNEFENTWLTKFRDQNPSMQIIKLHEGTDELLMTNHHHHGHHHHDDHEKESLDPHVWLSPKNLKKITHNIFEALSTLSPEHKTYFQNNYETVLMDIETLEQELYMQYRDRSMKGRYFMVFHPAYGHFAKQFGLKQVAIEVEGKSPKPKELAKIITKAKEHNIKVIISDPQISDKTAHIIAKEIGANVVQISPIDHHWATPLRELAKAIRGQ
jgi:zinc transport system substrate-binding protein